MEPSDELAAVLRDAADEHGVPGGVAAVLTGDLSLAAAHGVTNVEYPNAVSPATLFQVGSVSKTFTSAAVMLLVEEGRLALDDPVAAHLPTLGAATGLDVDAITVELALSHQAGFDGDHLLVDRAHDLTALATARRLFPPGEGYSYNNAGFSIAGAVVEAASGQDFASFVRRRLLRPLGMRSASFRADDAITYPVAAPHWVVDGEAHVLRRGGWQPGWELASVDHAAGGLIASVEHLVAWCRFQLTGTVGGDERLLSAESLERLHTPVVRADLRDQIALDWFVRSIDGATSIGHGGVTAGYVTDLLIVPEHGFAFVGITNATSGAAVNQRVRRWALERFAGLHEADPEPDDSLVIDADRCCGRFLDPFAVLDVTTTGEPRRVVVTPAARDDTDGWQPPVEPAHTLAFVTEQDAITLDAPGPQHVVRFGFDADGRADWLLWEGRRAIRAT